MDINREQFWEDIDSGEVHFQDQWHFAIKSNFFPSETKNDNCYTQEFYFFIPNALQINAETYTKQTFYLDQTTLIRYKTPEIPFNTLLDLNDPISPLSRIISLCGQSKTAEQHKLIEDELKLLANVFRSTLRQETKQIQNVILEKPKSKAQDIAIACKTLELCNHIHAFLEKYTKVKEIFLAPQNHFHLDYIDDFLWDMISYFLSKTLKAIRNEARASLQSADNSLTQFLLAIPISNKDSTIQELLNHPSDSLLGESLSYETNLLHSYILEALQLHSNRYPIDQRYQHYLRAFSAGAAILFYLVLFAWLGHTFVFNSAPFIVLAAVLYVIKDRLKETINAFSFQKVSAFFQDFRTVIGEKQKIGMLTEVTSFLNLKQLPNDIREMRDAKFHSFLRTYQRPESILFYRRVVNIKHLPKFTDKRKMNLSVIFRLNLRYLLRQASEPIEERLYLNPITENLNQVLLPKVYHINIIIKNSLLTDASKTHTEFKKLRLIVNKDGICRIEQM